MLSKKQGDKPSINFELLCSPHFYLNIVVGLSLAQLFMRHVPCIVSMLHHVMTSNRVLESVYRL